jgi:M6 family metalloprotease-like protein
MRNYRLIITGLLLSLVTLTAIAQEKLSSQGCRRGTPRPQSAYLRRGGSEGRTPGGDFYHGERHQLTVLVAFNDRLFLGDEAATLEQWNKIFNAENYMEGSFKGSVHDYFMAQSYGDFNVVFDLVYVQVSGNAKKYASTDDDDENSQYLVEDIVDILKTLDIDWGKYDWNGDGNINQLLIVYAGRGMHESIGSDLIWPHQWWMSEHLKDRQQGVYCDPIPVSAGDKDYLIDCYCALNELRRSGDYGSFGIICHEYSHCFGLPDFYYGSNNKTVGDWDLMDNGNYNGGGFLPAGYSAHERWLMGWLTPVELKSTTSVVNMPGLAEKGSAYLIRNDGYENEYYMVENRQPIGWDAGLPGSGILVFHIDYDPSVWTSTETSPNSTSRKRYELFHANNRETLYGGWAYPYNENNSLTNTSKPAATLYKSNSDGTKFMSKPITNMSVTGGLASFDFAVTTPTGMSELTTDAGADQLLYRFGMVDIVRDDKGNIRKIIRK